jgi:hypothetical protein
MFSVFKRSANGLSLTPGERAYIKLIKGWLFTGVAAGVLVLGQYLAAGVVDWQHITYGVIGAVVLTVLNSVEKYATSHGDTPLAIVAQVAEAKVEQALPPQAPPQVQPRFTTPVPQPQFVQAAPFPYQPSSTYPQMPAMQGQ